MHKAIEKLSKHYPLMIILCISFLFITPQLMNKSIIFGADVPFHFNRIYDNYMQLKNHNLNFFQMNYGFNQTGRIINALYGPGFAYLLGFILFICKSWLKFQIITSFIIFLVSGILMYNLATKLNAKKIFATLAAVLFMSSYWVSSWVTVESFMAWGTMLMPLVVMIGVDMINSNLDRHFAFKLAIIVALMVQVHILSALFSVFTILIFFIIGLIKNKNRVKLIVKSIQAGLMCVLLTANVWGAMLDVFGSNSIVTPFPVTNMSKETVSFSVGNTSIYELGLVVSIIYLFQIIYVCYKRNETTLINRVVTVIGSVFLLLSSNIVPWATIGDHFSKAESLLQFPYRFLTMATVLLIVGFSLSLSECSIEKQSNARLMETITIIGACLVAFQTFNGIQKSALVWRSNWPISTGTSVIKTSKFDADKFRNSMRSENLKDGLKLITKGYPDYLPTTEKDLFKNNNPYGLYAEQVIFNQKGFHKSVKTNELIISWHSKKRNTKKLVPVVVYKNSKVVLNGNKINTQKLKLTKLGIPYINSKQGTNTMKISYEISNWYKILLLITVLSWILILITFFAF